MYCRVTAVVQKSNNIVVVDASTDHPGVSSEQGMLPTDFEFELSLKAITHFLWLDSLPRRHPIDLNLVRQGHSIKEFLGW
jgi:hypothetical protein